MQAKRISLEKCYPIDIGRSVAGTCVADYLDREAGSRNALIITDREVAGYYLKDFSAALSEKVQEVPHIIVDGNPSSKTMEALKPVFEQISDRDCGYVIALGGGGVIDIATFAASTFAAGVRSVLVPTTLLSMMESVMASHAALHFQSQKDIIRVPIDIDYSVIDVSFLQTLPSRYFSSGLAQIIQYGLIDNTALLHALSASKDTATLIEESIRSGNKIRRTQPELMNFGRDIADAIECHFRFLKYTPGEALARALLAMCHSPALHKLYERLGLPVMLTEVGKETLLKRIAKTLETRGDTVDLVRIGPEKKPLNQKVSADIALRYYDSVLSEICNKAGAS